MNDFGLRDVPCVPCQLGYNDPHECESPDYCPCDRAKAHTPVVKGSTIRVTRLDPEGKPIGETFDINGELAPFPETGPPVDWLKPTTVEFTLLDPDPDATALLYGLFLKPRPRWWKLLPKRLRNWIKMRELRRGYGG